MLWKEWEPLYLTIVKDLDIDPDSDMNSAYELNKLINIFQNQKKEKITDYLRSIFHNPVIVFGAGPSLEEDYQKILSQRLFNKVTSVAVDGATSLFFDNGNVPDIVFTDLDGNFEAISWALLKGSFCVIHAHGDNADLIDLFFSENDDLLSRTGNYCGTTQNRPFGSLYNFGGFTDGDRAVLAAIHFQAPIIGLVGFDFGSLVGKYSYYKSRRNKNPQRKMEKLKWGKYILEIAIKSFPRRCYNLTSAGGIISGIRNVSVADFASYLEEF